jgi:lipopolysaccharide export system protein LptC
MAFATTPFEGNSAPLDRRPREARGEDPARAREFHTAKRHSVRVRVLKVLLPTAATAILSLYLLPSLFKVSIDNGRGTASVRTVTLEAGSLKMLDPHVRGVNERNEPYDFLADSATQASKGAEEMYLDNIRGRMTGQDGKITTLTAPNGLHNNKADQMTFNNGVVVKREPDMTATFQTATAFIKQQTVISKTPVIVRLHESTIHAESMTMFWGEQRAVFEGNVRTHVERQAEEAASGRSETQPSSAAGWAVGAAPAN